MQKKFSADFSNAMKLTIINGTNRVGNQTQTLTDAVAHQARALGDEVFLVDLSNFGELFRGEYLTPSTATGAQRDDLQKMVEAARLRLEPVRVMVGVEWQGLCLPFLIYHILTVRWSRGSMSAPCRSTTTSTTPPT